MLCTRKSKIRNLPPCGKLLTSEQLEILSPQALNPETLNPQPHILNPNPSPRRERQNLQGTFLVSPEPLNPKPIVALVFKPQLREPWLCSMESRPFSVKDLGFGEQD